MSMSKKILAVLCLFVATAAVSCKDNPALTYRYNAEKKFYLAERRVKDMQIKPELNTPEQVKQLQTIWKGVVLYTLDALQNVDSTSNRLEFDQLSTLAQRSTVRLAQMLFSEKRYDTCVTLFATLLTRARLTPGELMNTYVLYGEALQASGNWDSASAVYTRTLSTYYPPVDADGNIVLNLFNVPMLMYRVANMSGDSTNADKYYRRADDYYQGIIKSYPQSNLATGSHGNLARLYYDTRQWQNSIDQLRNLKDSLGNIILSSQMRIADINGIHLRHYDLALAEYDSLVASLTGRDTLIKPVIMFKKSQVYVEKKQYETARRLLVELADKYPGYYNFNPMTQITKARTFELQGNWERAESEYKFVIEQYDGTDEAMSTHLYLAKHFAETGHAAEAKHWYDRAEKYFDQVAARNPGTEREAKALMFKAEMYRQLKQWDKAAATLSQIYTKYPESDFGRNALLTAATLYRARLDKPAVADSLIGVFKRSFLKPDDTWENPES